MSDGVVPASWRARLWLLPRFLAGAALVGASGFLKIHKETLMSFAQEREDLEQALQASYTPGWVSSVVAIVFYGFLLIRYDVTDRVLGLSAGGFGWVLAYTALLFVALLPCHFLGSTYLGPILFHRFTGLFYRRERMAYARAGGYDVNSLAPILTEAALFGVYWWTAEMTPDPVSFLRSIWFYLLLTIALALGLSAAAYSLLFWGYARRL
jgi:hypothetical protein